MAHRAGLLCLCSGGLILVVPCDAASYTWMRFEPVKE